MSANVAVVIPNHKEELNDLEKVSLAQVRKVLKNYPLIFAGPEGINFSYLEPGDMVVQFHPQHFQSVKTYSNLLLTPMFYEPFLDFDYILIYQLDAFVFYDALEEFCRLCYDYIGAPWPYYAWHGVKLKRTPRVGNGGFCLRKVKACHKLLSEAVHWANFGNICKNYYEDAFFAICGVAEELNFNVAPVEVANLFAMDYYPDRHVKKLSYKLPFGCHDWTKYSADFYVELFAKFGYDLRPFRDQMKTNDYEIQRPLSLIEMAMKRLIRDLDLKKSLLQYLPTKSFASVRVIRAFAEMKILSRLLVDENFLTDKIFIYDKKNSNDLIRDLTREPLPHLIIALKYDDTPLLKEIEQKGLNYGEHFILFQHEYMKSQEKLFHNLGR